MLAEHPTRGLSPTLSQKQKHVMQPRARVQNGYFSARGVGGKSAYSAPKAHQVRRHNPKPHLDQERNLVPPPHRQIGPAVNLATSKASSESALMVLHPVNRAAHGGRCALCCSSGSSSNGGLTAWQTYKKNGSLEVAVRGHAKQVVIRVAIQQGGAVGDSGVRDRVDGHDSHYR